MNSKFNKSMLWVVMLSAVSQVFPMAHLSRAGLSAMRRAQHGAANILPNFDNVVPAVKQVGTAVAAGAVAADGIAAVGAAVATEVGSKVAETVTAQEIAQQAAQDVANGNIVTPQDVGAQSAEEITKWARFQKFVGESVFTKANFYGFVTIGSSLYFLHETGVLVKAKNNWKAVAGSLAAAAIITVPFATAYPEAAKTAVKSVGSIAGNLIRNPYVAGVTATAGSAVLAKKLYKNGYTKSGLITGAAAGLTGLGTVGTAAYNNFGWMKDYAVLAKDLAKDYVVTPIVEAAKANPKTAIAAAGTIGIVAAGLGVQYLRKPAAKKKPVPAKKNNKNKQGSIAALQGQIAQLTNAVTALVSKPFVAAPVNNQPAQDPRRAAPVDLNAKANGWRNTMKDMLSLVDQAVKGDKKALAAAKDLAKGNPTLIAHIDTMMKGSFAKLARLQARGQACERKQMNAAYTQVEAAHKAIAQICNLQYQRPAL